MFGVEPIYRVMQIAPSCYRLHAARRRNWVTAGRDAGRANHLGKLAPGTRNDVMDEARESYTQPRQQVGVGTFCS